MKNVQTVILTNNKQQTIETIEKEVTISYISDTEPQDQQIEKGAIWVDTSKQPPHVKVYINGKWEEADTLNQYVIAQDQEPTDPYESLMWYDTQAQQLKIYINGQWQVVSTQGSGGGSTKVITYKGDDKTITIDDTNTIHVLFNNEETKEPGYVWDNKRIQKEALIKALIFG